MRSRRRPATVHRRTQAVDALHNYDTARIIHGTNLASRRILMSTSAFAVAQQRWAINPGALQPLVQSYNDHLVALGYRAATIHSLEKRTRHFCYWLNQSDIAGAQIDDSVINQFARHSCQCPGSRASDIL